MRIKQYSQILHIRNRKNNKIKQNDYNKTNLYQYNSIYTKCLRPTAISSKKKV